MKSLKTLMYNGIKYFFCPLYTNSLLHFCASDTSPVTVIPHGVRTMYRSVMLEPSFHLASPTSLSRRQRYN